jgi:hypothetical protein
MKPKGGGINDLEKVAWQRAGKLRYSKFVVSYPKSLRPY